jgi:hypothetical protein
MMGKSSAKELADLQPMSRTDLGLILAVVVGAVTLVEVLGKGVIGLALIVLVCAFCLLAAWAIAWALVKLLVWLFGRFRWAWRERSA